MSIFVRGLETGNETEYNVFDKYRPLLFVFRLIAMNIPKSCIDHDSKVYILLPQK